MSAPNLGNLTLHAAGKITGATGVLANGVNMLAPTRTGAGIYVLNLGTEIDETQRLVVITPLSAVDVSVTADPAVQTDSTVGILGFDVLGAAGDVDFYVAVYRTSRPS